MSQQPNTGREERRSFGRTRLEEAKDSKNWEKEDSTICTPKVSSIQPQNCSANGQARKPCCIESSEEQKTHLEAKEIPRPRKTSSNGSKLLSRR